MIEDEGKEFKEILDKYEQYLQSGKESFFDQDDLLDIIDYYYDKDDHKKVSAALDLGMSLYPENAEFVIRKAQYTASVISSQEALKFMLYFRSQFEKEYDFMYYLACLYSTCCIYDKAIGIYDELLKENNQNKEVLYSLGNIYMTQQSWEKASQTFYNLLQIDEKNENALEAISYCAQYSEKKEKYLEFLHTLCHRNAYSEANWTYYGLMLYYMNRNTDAID